MATTHGSKRVECRSCAWRGSRVLRDPMNPNSGVEVSGFGPCPACGHRLVRQSVRKSDRQAAKAKAELQALEEGAQL